MLFNMIDERTIEKKNESELIIYFKNGSYYQLIGADNPDRLRGAGPVGMVLDEYDTMKEDVWPILQPIVRANGGWAWFVGTPKGKAKLYDLYNLGQSGDPEWQSWLLKASTSGIIEHKQLENSRKTMSQALYNQEFECDFLEGEGSVFRNVRRAATAIPQPPVPGRHYVMGVDLAKVQDYTVIAVYDRLARTQVYQDRFKTLEWPFQRKRIHAIAKRYNDALAIVDATGIGDPIVDDLRRLGLAVEPFKITNITKKEMIEKLSVFIENMKITIIPLEESFLEFDNFSYEISRQGKVTYNAREGYHDDIVIAHALAVQYMHDFREKQPENESLIKQELRKRLANPYNEEDIYYD